jgi:hypothetical protein
MISKSLVAIVPFAALALLAITIPPAAASAKEMTSTRSQLPCAAKKPQKFLAATPPQRRENRRAPIFTPPKTLKGKPMW